MDLKFNYFSIYTLIIYDMEKVGNFLQYYQVKNLNHILSK